VDLRRAGRSPLVLDDHVAGVPQYPHDRGYAVTREEAMAEFKTAWEGALGNGSIADAS